jgi:hypothetical protein
MLNENYIECFEDVELNLKCIMSNYKNIICNKSVAYHYESQSRDDSNDKLKKMEIDFLKVLLPFINLNINKISPYIK